ncbi:hypothetical protein DXG03_009299 [Asterophora parasitica]|uniref:BHLH domain-containing protein n=1 Tax=Asterophora parasitica TaxID=117018 RepID=A0A9P7KAZ5_9AGAR|nr:hypothetical protein DXG03_009299 [Asterophora parasitica]
MSHNPQNGNTKAKDPSPRQSLPPLAPLQFLQNQRRGSITDPSLHAAPNHRHNGSYRPPGEQAGSSSSGGGNDKAQLGDPRPTSPYVFGDATPHSGESLQIRNLLRTPSLEKLVKRPASTVNLVSADTDMDVDSSGPVRQPGYEGEGAAGFDYSMRRHSIAVGGAVGGAQGTKRKMSGDRIIEEGDGQLGGPGVPSGQDDGRATKRRGSAIDTARIAQLSLNERRNSVDSRPPAWYDRRDSTTSSLFNLGYPSAFSGADPPQRPAIPSAIPPAIASFAWPNTDQPMHTDHDPNTPQRPPFDPAIMPITFAPDRRLSVPDTDRALRSRSRPPSRPAPTEQQPVPSTSAQDEQPLSAPSPTGSGRHKDASNTPYSRSPELRVSHKLAERKRRKEMKDLFDELRDQLPADRGMKASKWEILSKAIDFVAQLKQSHQDMAREMEMLRHELEVTRQAIPFAPGGPPPHVVYGQPPVPGQFPPGPPPPGALHHPHAPHPQHPLATPPQHPPPPPNPPLSRPPSSQNVASPGAPGPPLQNGDGARTEPPPPT